jgi:hypothetical protein
MIRKWLFGGITFVLVAVLISLIVQGHRLEKRKASQPAEIVQESVPTATRVLAPKDIQILHSNMRLEEGFDKSSPFTIAWHEIELRNSGAVSYEKMELNFDYVDRGGNVLAERTNSFTQTILPDSTLKLVDIRINDVPVETADFRVAVVYADIGSDSDSEKQRDKG